MTERLSLTVLDGGPLKVSGAEHVTYCGDRVPVDGDLYLCRCGESSNAPFCDGTHRSNGFTGVSEPRAKKPIKVWEGRTLRTHFNANACMHVFYCKPLAELRERELAGDDAAADEIVRVVGECPSGALTFERTARGDEAEAPGEGPQIEIVEGGEVRVRAPHDISAELPERHDGVRGTLCRCGLSKNKPWCDGRHRKRKGLR